MARLQYVLQCMEHQQAAVKMSNVQNDDCKATVIVDYVHIGN